MFFSEDKPIVTSRKFAAYQRMFSEAGTFAVMDAKARGLPITYVEGEQIIKEYIDGRKEVLGTIQPGIFLGKKKISLTK